ncbi:hypothetical protein QQP08_015771 [Theobroma cacao]|nr:hypothetical protein QQP08_015771 [Theobroma cacao]
MRGTRVQIPWLRGRLTPAKESRTLDLPDDWSPTTTIVGSCMPSFMTIRSLSLSMASSKGADSTLAATVFSCSIGAGAAYGGESSKS